MSIRFKGAINVRKNLLFSLLFSLYLHHLCTSPRSAGIFSLSPGFLGPYPLLLPHRGSFGRRGPRPHCSCRECTLQPSPPLPLEVCFCTRSRYICCRFLFLLYSLFSISLFMGQISAVQKTKIAMRLSNKSKNRPFGLQRKSNFHRSHP